MNGQPLAHHVVDFYGQKIPTAIFPNHDVRVAMRPIVLGIGLDWSSQSSKLAKNKIKFNYGDIAMVAEDGKQRLMGCLPLKKLNGWLFSINPEKVRPEIKGKVIWYQEECFQVLYDYWHHGAAVNRDFCQTAKEKTDFYDAMHKSAGNYTFAQAAKILNLGRNTMLKLLRDNGILINSRSEWNMPYQAHLDSDYFVVEPTTIDQNEDTIASKQVFVTPKGIMWLQKLLLNHEIGPVPVGYEPPIVLQEKALDAVLFDVFGPEIEANKAKAIPASEVVECCGEKWNLSGRYCGNCGRSLKFVKSCQTPKNPKKSEKKSDQPKNAFSRLVESLKDCDDLLEKEYLKIRQTGENPPSREEIIDELKKEVQIKGGFLRVLTRD